MIAVRKWSPGRFRSVGRWMGAVAVGWAFLLSGLAMAQDWCGKDKPAQAGVGGFTLRSKKGCAPFTAQIVSIPASVSNAKYIFDYKGGDPFSDSLSKRQTSNVSFTYTKPGKYRILQLGSGGGVATGTVYCDEVEVYDVSQPTVNVSSCSGGRVTLTVVNDAIAKSYDEFRISWGDGQSQTVTSAALAPIQHTYTDVTPRIITVQPVHTGGNCGPAPKTIQVTPGGSQTKPVITRLSTSESTVTIQVQAAPGQTVVLHQKNASGTYAPTLLTRTGSGSLTVPNVTTHSTCFKLVVQSNCDRPEESDEACSIGLDVEAQEKQNAVRWTALAGSTGFRRYTITRNGAPLNSFTAASTASTTDNQQINCGQQYCYQVTALVGATEIVSDRKCVTAKSSEVPPAFSVLQVSVNGDNGVDVRGLPPISPAQNPVYKMLVLRSDRHGAPFSPAAEAVNNNVVQDGNVQTRVQSYCYQIVYQNACGVSSEPSPTVCTIWLASQTPSTIDWTTDSPFAGESVDRYLIEKLDENGIVRDEINIGKDNSYRPDLSDPDIQRFRFRVKAISPTGAVSYSNFYTLTLAPRLFVPDAFTPNGDGVNDRFEIKGSAYFESIQMTIFNRWGEALFRTEGREGWDGLVNGQPALPGSYTYRIDTKDQTGQQTVKTGSVLLIR